MPQTPGTLTFPYILFDLGSTLIYFEGDWAATMVTAVQVSTQYLRSLGYNLDEQAFSDAYYAIIQEYHQKRNDKFVEYTSEHVLRKALSQHSYPAPPPEHMRQALKAMYAVTQKHWHLEADAVPMLETLRERGHRLAVVSNASDDEDVQTLVDMTHLRPYFDFILTSAVAGVRKPTPMIFEKALDFWGARPDQALMIGDTVSADVVGAKHLGMANVWIIRRNDTPENRAVARAYPPDASIYALSELPGLLEHWPDKK